MKSSLTDNTDDLLDAAERSLSAGQGDASVARDGLARLACAAHETGDVEAAALAALLADLLLIASVLPGGTADSDPRHAPDEINALCRSSLSLIRGGLERQPGMLQELSDRQQDIEERWGEYLELLAPGERCRPFPEEYWQPQCGEGWSLDAGAPFAESADDFEFDAAVGIDLTQILSALAEAGIGPEEVPSSDQEAQGKAGLPLSASSLPVAASLPAPSLSNRSQIDPELLPAYLDDAEQCLTRMEQSLLLIESAAGDREPLRQFCRELHTLKGASGTVGFTELSSYLHQLEDRVEAMTAAGAAVDVDLLLAGIDVVRGQFSLLQGTPGGASGSTAPHERTVPKGPKEQRDEGQGGLTLSASRLPSCRTPPRPSAAVESSPQRQRTAPQTPSENDGENLVRIEASRLDRLMDLLAELVMLRNRRDTYLSQLMEWQHDLGGCVKRIRACGQLVAPNSGNGEASDQLRRQLTVTADELAEQNRRLRDIREPLKSDNEAVSHLVGQFRQELTDLRRLPLTGLFRRLQRVGRDAARIEHKQVELEFAGQGTRAERLLQDRLFEPLMHLVRNAVSHGIESPEERQSTGKPAAGRIVIQSHATASALFIELADDGRGLNEEALERRGRELGILSPGEPVTPEQLWKLIFHPGFSTRREVSELSGRGVGMDVVASRIRQLRGRLDVRTVAGQGTTFRLQIPLRSPIEHAMVVRVRGQLFAFPMQSIYGTGPRRTETAGPVEADDRHEQPIPPLDLGQLLGFRESTPSAMQVLTLCHHTAGEDAASTEEGIALHSGGAPRSRQLTISVDKVVGVEEVVLRSLPPMLQGHELFAGVTLSGDAETVLLFDVPRLIERGLRHSTSETS